MTHKRHLWEKKLTSSSFYESSVFVSWHAYEEKLKENYTDLTKYQVVNCRDHVVTTLEHVLLSLDEECE